VSYDARAGAVLATLAADPTERAHKLSDRLVKLLGTDSPRLLSAVHEAEAFTAKRFDPREPRDHHGRWTDTGGGASGGDTPNPDAGSVTAEEFVRRFKPRPIDRDEKMAVEGYVGASRLPAADEINGMLRRAGGNPEESGLLTTPLATSYLNLDSAIMRQKPLVKPVVVYRGTDPKYVPAPGEESIERGFMSSTTEDRLDAFSGPGSARLRLHLAPGVHALPVDVALQDPSGEHEVLLQRDLVLRTRGTAPDGIIDVDVFPPRDGDYPGPGDRYGRI
jgi:hypothetical protein